MLDLAFLAESVSASKERSLTLRLAARAIARSMRRQSLYGLDDGRNCRFVPGACGKVDNELAAARGSVHAEQAALDVLGARVPPDSDELCALKTGNAGLILIACVVV